MLSAVKSNVEISGVWQSLEHRQFVTATDHFERWLKTTDAYFLF